MEHMARTVCERSKQKEGSSMRHKTITKPGKHGTLTLFWARYQDNSESSPTFSQSIWAYDRTHAEDKFWNTDDTDWKLVEIVRAYDVQA